MKWTDVQDIAYSLEEAYPDEDVQFISFTRLKKLVVSLPDFEDDPKRCNERILEAIQEMWLDEQD